MPAILRSTDTKYARNKESRSNERPWPGHHAVCLEMHRKLHFKYKTDRKCRSSIEENICLHYRARTLDSLYLYKIYHMRNINIGIIYNFTRAAVVMITNEPTENLSDTH